MDRMEFKITLIGDGDVGKTTWIKRHMTGEFEKNYNATLGVEIQQLTFSTNVGQIVFNIWDTAGQEKFSELAAGYYTESDAAIIMFDIGSTVTFKNVPIWLKEFKEICKDVPIVIVGNKIDIKEQKVSLVDRGSMTKISDHYYDISAKSCYNFEKPFLWLARKFTNNRDLEFVPSPPFIPPKINTETSEPPGTTIIMLSGDMRAGKDTFGNILEDILGKNFSINKGSFAASLKDAVQYLFEVPIDDKNKEVAQDHYPVNANSIDPLLRQKLFKYDQIDPDQELYWTPRMLMQALGWLGRCVNPDFWVKRMYIDPTDDYFIITDWRYVNEVDALRRLYPSYNIVTVRIERPGNPRSAAESENQLKDYKFDRIVFNDGTIEDFKAKALYLTREF